MTGVGCVAAVMPPPVAGGADYSVGGVLSPMLCNVA